MRRSCALTSSVRVWTSWRRTRCADPSCANAVTGTTANASVTKQVRSLIGKDLLLCLGSSPWYVAPKTPYGPPGNTDLRGGHGGRSSRPVVRLNLYGTQEVQRSLAAWGIDPL